MKQMHSMTHATTMNAAVEATSKINSGMPKNGVDIDSFCIMMMMNKKTQEEKGKRELRVFEIVVELHEKLETEASSFVNWFWLREKLVDVVT